MLTTEKLASALNVGSHGTTYGGNPLAGAVGGKVLELINRPEVLEGAVAPPLVYRGAERHQPAPAPFKEVRGLGLLIGGVLNEDFSGKAKQISWRQPRRA